tara:strand:- start:1116 stop:1553 length:438 start_codon:yes stop_codon:yes gene_type:complete
MKKKLLETFKRIGGNRLNESTPGYENRKFGDKLPTLDSVRAAHQAKHNIKEEDGDYVRTNDDGEFDYEGALSQVDIAIDAINGIEEDLVRGLDMIANDETIYGLVRDKAGQAVNQVRRYINGAQKQIEGINKLLKQAQRNGEFDA